MAGNEEGAAILQCRTREGRRKRGSGSSEAQAASSCPSFCQVEVRSCHYIRYSQGASESLKVSLAQVQGHPQSLSQHPPPEPVSVPHAESVAISVHSPARSEAISACTVGRILSLLRQNLHHPASPWQLCRAGGRLPAAHHLFSAARLRQLPPHCQGNDLIPGARIY